MEDPFAAAPWSASLKAVSVFGSFLLLAVGYAAYLSIPASVGFTHEVGLVVAIAPIVVLLATLLFVVRGYTVDGTELAVQRLLWTTRIPLAGLVSVGTEPTLRQGSIRVAGNGGLFSYSGCFYSKRLGRYRIFATDLSRAVALELPRGTIVVTPAAPDAFVEQLRLRFPGVRVGARAAGPVAMTQCR